MDLTNLATINEIYIGYVLAGNKWYDIGAKTEFERRMKSAPQAESAIQIERATEMAKCFKVWAQSKGYFGIIQKVWWTAKPGTLKNAVRKDVDSHKNPTDILVKYSSGPADGFLGLSAKSTSQKGDIGFKNLGLGTVEADLKINLSVIVTHAVDDIIRKFKLPENVGQRKEIIRSKPQVQKSTQRAGSDVLRKIRDSMHIKLKKLSQKDLKNYLLENWLDASNNVYPPYVKVTGHGNKSGEIKVSVSDPLKNDKLTAILKGPIQLQPLGDNAIGITSAGKRIMKMRAKFASEKLASSVKFSGDPWS